MKLKLDEKCTKAFWREIQPTKISSSLSRENHFTQAMHQLVLMRVLLRSYFYTHWFLGLIWFWVWSKFSPSSWACILESLREFVSFITGPMSSLATWLECSSPLSPFTSSSSPFDPGQWNLNPKCRTSYSLAKPSEKTPWIVFKFTSHLARWCEEAAQKSTKLNELFRETFILSL